MVATQQGDRRRPSRIGQVVQARIMSSDFSPRGKVLFGREHWWSVTLTSLTPNLRDCKRWETKYCERADEHARARVVVGVTHDLVRQLAHLEELSL